MLLIDAVPRFRGLLPEGAASAAEGILRSSGAVRASHVDAMRKPATLRFYEASERVLGQGQLAWFGVRKRWMADQVQAAIASGARQVLVVGAGFDPLAAMTAAAHPDVLCIEIDAPATAEPKRAGVEGAGLSRDNHRVVSVDLSQRSLAEVLGETPWRSDVRSVVVAEGLLMYLVRSDVEGFLAAVRASSGQGSRLAFSSMDADERGRPRLPALNGLIQWSLRLVGEPLRWGIRAADVPSFLAAASYRAIEQAALEELRARYLDPVGLSGEPLLPYEHLVLAEVIRP